MRIVSTYVGQGSSLGTGRKSKRRAARFETSSTTNIVVSTFVLAYGPLIRDAARSRASALKNAATIVPARSRLWLFYIFRFPSIVYRKYCAGQKPQKPRTRLRRENKHVLLVNTAVGANRSACEQVSSGALLHHSNNAITLPVHLSTPSVARNFPEACECHAHR